MKPQVDDLYKHYKGNFYQVTALATHVNKGNLVIYRDITDASKVWARDLEEFMSTVVVDGVNNPRFALVSREVNN